MARYVLVEFESNSDAERFVARTMEKELKGAKYKIVGFFAKPRKYCQCPTPPEHERAQQTRRGSKYGWMVHTKCGRPRREYSHSPRNLLDPQDTPANKISAFIHLTGSWAGEEKAGELLKNYPIAVLTKEGDK